MRHQDYAGDIPPSEAWRMLADNPRAVLIDVRTPAEWSFVGVPDLSGIGKRVVFVPWALYPGMEINPRFADDVAAAGVARGAPLLFLCRSGVRSRSAAIAMTQLGYAPCYNISEGFEGGHDTTKHRGTLAGWKVGGLPWVQS